MRNENIKLNTSMNLQYSSENEITSNYRRNGKVIAPNYFLALFSPHTVSLR